jgi:hypothetical protein
MTEPTQAQVSSACLSFRHDYGLLSEAEQKAVQFEAREWLHAWRKEELGLAQSPAAPSPIVLDPPPFGEGGLAGRMARHAKQFANHKGTVELTVTPKEIREIADALAPKAAVLDPVTVERCAKVAEAFDIPLHHTGVKPRVEQVEKNIAAAIRALIGEPRNTEADDRLTVFTNPEDTWDAYCADTPEEDRSPQGAIAFVIDRMWEALASPSNPQEAVTSTDKVKP